MAGETKSTETLYIKITAFLIYAAVFIFVSTIILQACSSNNSTAPEHPDGSILYGDADPSTIKDATTSTITSDASEADAGSSDIGLSDSGSLDASQTTDASIEDTGSQDSSTNPCEISQVNAISLMTALQDQNYLDKFIEIEGHLSQDPIICDNAVCSEDNACCQSCTATLSIGGQLQLSSNACADPNLGNIGCHGTNCGVVCRPQASSQTRKYIGRLKLKDSVRVLELYRVEF